MVWVLSEGGYLILPVLTRTHPASGDDIGCVNAPAKQGKTMQGFKVPKGFPPCVLIGETLANEG